ncbi:hypothetical protein ACH4MW_06345 [Streptomyces luteogriseus]|uniref:hypothetical protein n=1 Tax=Streptomyces luteogriseus TaxID=68233 RepID=UPI00379E75D7
MRNGRPELFFSAALENSSAGAVWVLPGGADGPTAQGSRMITASSVGLPQRENTQLGGSGLLG